uniref:BTB domain-containing protein n=1 Tax=Anopheles coluzzii TaxID=1518534 RepID=A0A8W7P2P1_ANOCL
MTADNADVTFIVQSEHLPEHRNILAARSEYFRALLYGGLKESQQNHEPLKLDPPPAAYFFALKIGSRETGRPTAGTIPPSKEEPDRDPGSWATRGHVPRPPLPPKPKLRQTATGVGAALRWFVPQN